VEASTTRRLPPVLLGRWELSIDPLQYKAGFVYCLVNQVLLIQVRLIRFHVEKVPGSGAWWVRYFDAQGRLRREKAGTKGNAKDLYTKRKNEALSGKKMPEKLRIRAVSFDEIADDATTYVKAHYSRPADDVDRLKVLKGWFRGQAAETIKAHQVETKLESARLENHWAPATVNHYHTAVSLAFRLAIAKDKVKENPARKIRRVPEDNNRVRYLSAERGKETA